MLSSTIIRRKAKEARAMLGRQKRALSRIVEHAEVEEDVDAAQERLIRWRARTEELLAERVHPDELESFKTMLIKSPLSEAETMEAFLDEAYVYDRFLSSLAMALIDNPEEVLIVTIEEDVTARSMEASEGTEVLRALSFDFIATKELKQIVERDKTELLVAYQSRLWKSAILLCGGLAEAMLCDMLHEREQEAQKSYKERWPKKKPGDLLEWDLYELTTVAGDLGEVSADVTTLANTLRGWRNLVHPGKEARGVVKPQQEEADIALHMIRLLARDLSTKGPKLEE